MPTVTANELIVMKDKIEKAKVNQAKLEGQLQDRMARLKQLGFDTVEAAEEELERLHTQIADLDDRVKRGIEELKSEYGL